MFRFRLQALNQHKNDIKIAIGGYHATLMYEEIASTDDGTPSGFTRKRGKSREVTVHLKGECESTVLYANRWKRIVSKRYGKGRGNEQILLSILL